MSSASQHSPPHTAAAAADPRPDADGLAADFARLKLASNRSTSRVTFASNSSAAGDSDSETSERGRINASKSKKKSSNHLTLKIDTAQGRRGSSGGRDEQRSASGNHLRPNGASVGRLKVRRRKRSKNSSKTRRSRHGVVGGEREGGGTAATAAPLEDVVPHSDNQSPPRFQLSGAERKGVSEPSSASVSMHGNLRKSALGRASSVPEKRLSTSRAFSASAVPNCAFTRRSTELVEGQSEKTRGTLATAEPPGPTPYRTDDGSERNESVFDRILLPMGQLLGTSNDMTPLNRATLEAVEKTVEAIDDLRGRPEHDIDKYVDHNVEDATLSVVRHCLKAVLSMDVDRDHFDKCATLAEAEKKRRKQKKHQASPAAVAPRAKQSVPSHVVARRKATATAAAAAHSSAGPPPRVRPAAQPKRGYEWVLRRIGFPQDMANYYYYRHSLKPRYKWVQIKIPRRPAQLPYDWAAEAGYKPFDEDEIWKCSDKHHFPPYSYPLFGSLRHPFSKADAPPQTKIAPLVALRRPRSVVETGGDDIKTDSAS